MADSDTEPGNPPVKKGKFTAILCLMLALAGAGAGYFAVTEGLFPVGQSAEKSATKDHPASAGKVAFVELPAVMISISGAPEIRHIRFRAHLEVEPDRKADVAHLVPRVMDVLNGYLRALEVAELEDSMALVRLRAQMLRRVQLIIGPGAVRDLLVMEFVLS